MKPTTLITITHTGAYSMVAAAKASGAKVCAPQGIHVDNKVALIKTHGKAADLIWAHWSWVGLLPQWIFGRHVVVVLRDPMECAISAVLRNQGAREAIQARQWLNLYENAAFVDEWVQFPPRKFFGQPVPHLNATNKDPLKTAYRDNGYKGVKDKIHPWHACLRVVRPEINAIFKEAGMLSLIKGTMFDQDTTKARFDHGVV